VPCRGTRNAEPMSTDERVADILAKIREEPDRPAADVAAGLCGDDQKLLADVLAELDSMTREAAATVELDLDRTVEQTAAATPFSDVPPLPGRRISGEAGGSRPRRKGGGRFRRPDRVGVFQIDAEMPIGRGGFGEVWEGSRAEGGFRQRVAIKILSRSTSDETVVKRFELERQVLASLDHPDIARLIDGGTLDDDRPWLAMEFVEGTTITAFCDRERLSIEERIRLTMRVAMAVQHAHENLVVHRDIKPDNVMVTPNGDPKLLDFGIAKIVNPDLGGLGSRMTQDGEGVLTPDYAAPEQFTGESIGTRADVYSLGVVLYELLTGRLPFADVDRGYVNIRDAKLETEPLRPSEAVSTASIDAEAAKRISTGRNSGIDRIRRRLDGDIDVIILKALRREPSRRYGSPREFVDDLQRHLEGLPVEARPESIAYVTTRFLARHRAGFAVSIACLLAIAFASLAAVAVLTAQASEQQLEITSARADAETARAEAAEQVRAALADLEIEAAASGTESLIRSLQEANQLDTAGTLGALMLDRLERVSKAVPDDATIQARKLALRLQQARIQWQRRNPSLGDSAAAASIRSEIAEELESARARHPDSIDLLLVAAQRDRDRPLHRGGFELRAGLRTPARDARNRPSRPALHRRRPRRSHRGVRDLARFSCSTRGGCGSRPRDSRGPDGGRTQATRRSGHRPHLDGAVPRTPRTTGGSGGEDRVQPGPTRSREDPSLPAGAPRGRRARHRSAPSRTASRTHPAGRVARSDRSSRRRVGRDEGDVDRLPPDPVRRRRHHRVRRDDSSVP